MHRFLVTGLVALTLAVAGGFSLALLSAPHGLASAAGLASAGAILAGGAGVLVVRQVRLLRTVTAALQRLSASSGMHVYTGVMRPDGYHDVFDGPGSERFASGSSFHQWLAAIDPRDLDRYREAFRYERLAQGDPVEIEYRMRRLDGSIRWVVERAVPRRVGDSIWLDGVVIDQTPERAMERHAAQQQAVLAELVEATGTRFFSGRYPPDGPYEPEYSDPGMGSLIGVAGALALGELQDRWDRAVHPDDRGAVDALREANRLGEPADGVYRLCGEDGVVRSVVERTHAAPDPDGAIVVSGFVVDRTERIGAELELARTRNILERVIEGHRTHVYVGRVLVDGSYVEDYTGPGLAQLLGAVIPEGVDGGRFWESRVHPEDLELYARGTADLRGDGPYEMRYRVIAEDGTVRHLIDRGTSRSLGDGSSAVEGVVTDVTDQVLIADELRDMHQRLADVLRESRAHVFQITIGGDDEYEATYVGPGIEHVLAGHPPEGVEMAAYWRTRVLEEDHAVYDAGTARQASGEAADFEYRITRLDGVVRCVWERSHAADDRHGRRVVTGVISDVTERREAADEALVAHERLQAILAGVGQVVFTCEIEGRAVLYTAGDWAGLLGGAHGRPLDEVRARIHPDDIASNEAVWRAVAEGRDMEQTFRIVSPDGSLRWLRERVVPRRDPGGRLLLDGVAVDVTAFLEAEAALDEARGRLASIVEAIEEFLFTIEALPGGFRIDHVGPGFDRVVGGEPPEGTAVIDAWQERLHPDDADAFRAHLDTARSREAEVEVRVVGYDGVTRWMWMRSRPRPIEGRLLIDGIVSDVTERRLAAAALERLSRSDPLTGIANRRHFSTLARAALEHTGPLCHAGLILFDIDHFKRVNDVYGHAAGDAVMRELVARVSAVVPPGATVARWGGEEFAVLVERARRDHVRHLADRLRHAAEREPVQFAGVELSVTISCGGALSDGHQSLDSLVSAADEALYAAKRRGRNRTVLADELVDADLVAEDPEALRIAEAMARATAAREGVPEQHCHRVAELAVRVGARMGLSGGLVTRLRIGGWLHDIGKIAIPDRILSKPGKLDAAEWEIMKSHTILGMRLVEETPGLAEAALAVAHHHERWDGGGYPSGLAGAAIPIEARIVAAVDAWSAMTEDRPYRPGLGFDDALDELRRVAGSQLDPDVVGALVSVLLEESPGVTAEAA